jgi:hypothetical protein
VIAPVLSATERRLRGRLAAAARWSRTSDRTRATASLRAGFDARFERQVDAMHPGLAADLRARLIASARSEYFTRLAFTRLRARKKMTSGAGQAQEVKEVVDVTGEPRAED